MNIEKFMSNFYKEREQLPDYEQMIVVQMVHAKSLNKCWVAVQPIKWDGTHERFYIMGPGRVYSEDGTYLKTEHGSDLMDYWDDHPDDCEELDFVEYLTESDREKVERFRKEWAA